MLQRRVMPASTASAGSLHANSARAIRARQAPRAAPPATPPATVSEAHEDADRTDAAVSWGDGPADEKTSLAIDVPDVASEASSPNLPGTSRGGIPAAPSWTWGRRRSIHGEESTVKPFVPAPLVDLGTHRRWNTLAPRCASRSHTCTCNMDMCMHLCM